MADLKQQLLDLLKTRSLLRKQVILSSGQPSDVYIDCKQTTLSAQGLFLVTEIFWSMIETLRTSGMHIDAIAGPTLGADPLVCALAYRSFLSHQPLPAIIVRKQAKAHGTAQFLEGATHLSKGSQVLVIEDVVSTGRSMQQAITHIVNAGFTVSACMCMVDRLMGAQETFKRNGYLLHSIFKLNDVQS